jgi:hypothetical protein
MINKLKEGKTPLKKKVLKCKALKYNCGKEQEWKRKERVKKSITTYFQRGPGSMSSLDGSDLL